MKSAAARSAETMRLFSWIGLFLFGFACFLAAREAIRESFAHRTQGTITGFEYLNKSKSPVPVFQYSLPDGRVFTSNTGFSSSALTYEIGNRVTVLYWDSSPDTGTIEGAGFIPAWPLGVLGLAFAIIWRVAARLQSDIYARIWWYMFMKLP